MYIKVLVFWYNGQTLIKMKHHFTTFAHWLTILTSKNFVLLLRDVADGLWDWSFELSSTYTLTIKVRFHKRQHITQIIFL